jgi:uncharacterized membrane protein
MAQSISRTSHGDAPLSSAKHPNPNGSFDLPADEQDNYRLVGRTVTVNRPRSELYAFWRKFSNLARFMQNVHSVKETAPLQARWVLAAHDGQNLEWESAITEDIPNELIAWRSIDGAHVSNEGRVEFTDAPGGRGTLVAATLLFRHSGGAIGDLLSRLFHGDPKIHTRRELRRFKQLMETGEISTAAPPHAAPRA